MTFIVPGVCRYSINGEIEGVNVANVLDYEIDTTGSTQTRADAVYDQCGILINQWVNDVMPDLSNQYVFNNVSWVDLDDVDGTTGTRDATAAETLPQQGLIAGQNAPSGVAFLVKKLLAGSSRDKRNGRMYVCGVPAAAFGTTDPNFVTAATLAALQSDFDDFLANTDQEDFNPAGHQAHMCVVHILTRDPVTNAPLTGNHTNVNSLTVDNQFAYQRRRGGR